MADTKYYQNELTNIIAKTASIKMSMVTQKDEVTSALIKELFYTERNFKLSSGESIVKLEDKKIDNSKDIDTLMAIKEIISALKKGN